MIDLLSLFAVAFIAATLLPFYSEVLLLAIAAKGTEPVLLLATATAGNTLGAVVNWWLGKYFLHYQDRSWFPFKRRSLAGAQRWFNRFGRWSLLFAWLPVGGDALTFVAGVLRVPFLPFVLLTGTGKALRYAVVLGLGDFLLSAG